MCICQCPMAIFGMCIKPTFRIHSSFTQLFFIHAMIQSFSHVAHYTKAINGLAARPCMYSCAYSQENLIVSSWSCILHTMTKWHTAEKWIVLFFWTVWSQQQHTIYLKAANLSSRSDRRMWIINCLPEKMKRKWNFVYQIIKRKNGLVLKPKTNKIQSRHFESSDHQKETRRSNRIRYTLIDT